MEDIAEYAKQQSAKSVKLCVNFSNHPSDNWSKEQISEALKYGEIIDMPFPDVDPELDSDEISRLACEYTEKILEYDPAAVMCQGEMTLCFKVVETLKSKGILVLAACSTREVSCDTLPDGSVLKTQKFRFVRFRSY